jgi:hypothetical protein
MKPRTVKQNWFETLNESLASEQMVDLWPLGTNVGYGENVRVIVSDNGKMRLLSVYRETDGRYERVVTYLTGEKVS